jgi:hypothetical protein
MYNNPNDNSEPKTCSNQYERKHNKKNIISNRPSIPTIVPPKIRPERRNWEHSSVPHRVASEGYARIKSWCFAFLSLWMYDKAQHFKRRRVSSSSPSPRKLHSRVQAISRAPAAAG